MNIVHNLPISEYHNGPLSRVHVSKSGLDDIDRSPAHFQALRSPAAPARAETPAQLLGNMVHCAVLEPLEFSKRYVVGPDVATRAAKDWKAFEATLTANQTGVKLDEESRVRKMADSVLGLQNVWGGLSVAQLLRFAICESSVYWVDKATGVPCRCRPDAVATVQGGVVLLDVKTFGNASEFEFSRQVHGMRYHVQDAFYSAGYEDASGLKVLGFVFLVVEDKFPFAAAAYRLDADSRQQGLDEARINLETYAECQKSGVWPGYANTTTVISLPPYAFATQEVEVTYVPE